MVNREEVEEQLHQIVEVMLGEAGVRDYQRPMQTLLGQSGPFEYQPPNEHDSKASFQAELKLVKDLLRHLLALQGLLGVAASQADSSVEAVRMRVNIDYKLFRNAPRAFIRNPVDLVRKNIADSGGFNILGPVLADYQAALADRLTELKNQQEKFWNLKGRAPDHYARVIALHLARLYSSHTGRFPTLGTSGITGDPSTAYSRALKAVFSTLQIETRVRGPASWALNQLTEADLVRPKSQYPGTLPRGISLGH
ncbi:hypothetical protein ACFO5X_03300 [Seohaeicola nanhaiensis]|uniref:EcxA zinc-binding domain-containing protein n=1 Tax=Seohaeicola nanhaiensis TaxID=1387282 RepID=A0ABV9KBW5_9RHOB